LTTVVTACDVSAFDMFAGESVVETTSDELDVTDPCNVDPTYDFVSRNFRAAFSLENSDIVVECTGIGNEDNEIIV